MISAAGIAGAALAHQLAAPGAGRPPSSNEHRSAVTRRPGFSALTITRPPRTGTNSSGDHTSTQDKTRGRPFCAGPIHKRANGVHILHAGARVVVSPVDRTFMSFVGK